MCPCPIYWWRRLRCIRLFWSCLSFICLYRWRSSFHRQVCRPLSFLRMYREHFFLSLAYWENAYLLLACCGNNHFSFRFSYALLSFISVVTIYAGFGLASFLVPSFFTFLIIGFTVYQILILLFMEALKSYDAKKSKLSETAYPVQWYDLMKLSNITIISNHQECDWMYLTWSSAPNTEIYS